MSEPIILRRCAYLVSSHSQLYSLVRLSSFVNEGDGTCQHCSSSMIICENGCGRKVWWSMCFYQKRCVNAIRNIQAVCSKCCWRNEHHPVQPAWLQQTSAEKDLNVLPRITVANLCTMKGREREGSCAFESTSWVGVLNEMAPFCLSSLPSLCLQKIWSCWDDLGWLPQRKWLKLQTSVERICVDCWSWCILSHL